MPPGTEPNPFLRYRHHLDVYEAACRRGWSDERWVDTVSRMDARVAAVDGTGFGVTPLVPLEPSATGAGGGPVWAKVETANVSGSHKARHLFGVALWLLVDDHDGGGGGVGGGRHGRELAIASCGNAALAAATVAAALDRRLRVFVPVTADPAIVDRLHGLGAAVTASERRSGERGDPCVRDLHEAVAGGAVPFTVQGTICPRTFDGARTLGLELAEQLAQTPPVADLFVQVGGGALAVATMEGLHRGGATLPALRPVQTRSAHPFVVAWGRLVAWRRARPDPPDPLDAAGELAPLMEPWSTEPRSAATGILDDVTHDWLALASWTLRSAGEPVVTDEATLVEAATVAARLVEPPPDATGAAGLAGLLDARRSGAVDPRDGAVVLLTGVDRAWERGAPRPREPVRLRSSP